MKRLLFFSWLLLSITGYSQGKRLAQVIGKNDFGENKLIITYHYSIMQVTGHKTEQAFLKYIKITPREHAEKLQQFWQDQVKL